MCPRLAPRDTPHCSDQLFQETHDSIRSGIAICVGLRAVGPNPGSLRLSAVACTPTVLDGPPVSLDRAPAAHHVGRPFRGRPISLPRYAEMDCVSTRTPRPMVDETATFLRYTPLLVAGLALFKASISATKLPCSLSDSNERRPSVAWMMPALSARNCTWPALAFLTAVATSGVTVPTFGFGINPRGPRIWPS